MSCVYFACFFLSLHIVDFIVVVVLTSFFLQTYLRWHRQGLILEINIPRFVSSVLPPTKVDQAFVPEKNQLPRGFIFRWFVKPGQGACRGSKDTKLVHPPFKIIEIIFLRLRRGPECCFGLYNSTLFIVENENSKSLWYI